MSKKNIEKRLKRISYLRYEIDHNQELRERKDPLLGKRIAELQKLIGQLRKAGLTHNDIRELTEE